MAGHEEGGKLYGILAEFDAVDPFLAAARRVRDAGYSRWDTYSPFPVHGMNDAMGMRDTRLPWIVLGGGFAGCSGGLLMQWWMNAVDYPFWISGKPLFSLPANIPVAFETTILLSALAAVGGLFFLCDLPKFWHPTAKSLAFRRVTDDRFFICIEACDPEFTRTGTEELVRALGPVSYEWLED
jgi:hypothetical protein